MNAILWNNSRADRTMTFLYAWWKSETIAWESVEHSCVVVVPWSELADATLWLASLRKGSVGQNEYLKKWRYYQNYFIYSKTFIYQHLQICSQKSKQCLCDLYGAKGEQDFVFLYCIHYLIEEVKKSPNLMWYYWATQLRSVMFYFSANYASHWTAMEFHSLKWPLPSDTVKKQKNKTKNVIVKHMIKIWSDVKNTFKRITFIITV